MTDLNSEAEERESKPGLRGLWIPVFAAIYVAWVLLIILSGLGVRVGGPWDFEVVAHLGEAFGGLSALMAGLAAYFTLQALNDERAETKRLRAREARRDKADAERDLQQNTRISEERLRDLELTYFRMLEFRREILDDVQIGDLAGIKAFRNLKNSYNNLEQSEQFRDRYLTQYNNFDAVLGHYFRFTYHLIKFANESFDFPKAYSYVRMLRAQLSSGEQFLIALNAIFGEGKEKMLPLINRYGLLHNMPEADKARLIAFQAGLEPTAFEPPAELAPAIPNTE